MSAEVLNDDLTGHNRAQLYLRFQLASGQYATMLIRGLALLAGENCR